MRLPPRRPPPPPRRTRRPRLLLLLPTKLRRWVRKARKSLPLPIRRRPRGSQNGPIVREINVEYIGPKTVAKSVILSNMRTTVGDVYSAASVEEDVRNLYATGFFTNLAIKDEPLGDGVRVNVVVQPKPLVKEIVITGARKSRKHVSRRKSNRRSGSP